jgi:preprotein translocase subunit SecA
MEFLEKVWDNTTHVCGGLVRGFERTVTNLFGSSNARQVKKFQAKVDAITQLEGKYEAMTDDELVAQTKEFQDRLANGETTDDILVEAFAVCREGGKRFLQMRHYDVQMIGGMVLHSGAVAEMVTGEGKTLVATLPTYLNALERRGVHVITVNDYLARRDMEWMAPLYMGLGLTVGAIQSNMPAADRQKAYECDITYGTNNEFGFDYLRDNMRPAARGDDRFPKQAQQTQGPLAFAIIDEVDNILIDEARTPLIISGPAHQNPSKYADADRIARQLERSVDYIVNEKDHTATLTEEGIRKAEKMAGVESFYTAGNMDWPHLIDNALKAHGLYVADVNYVVKEGEIIIVDEFTGRLMEGRQWSDGLHQAVEAKEGVKIKEETQTLATITLQNYFKLYDKICGMTGTAMTEAEEFYKIYELDVVAIPTNRPLQRREYSDLIFCNEKYKWEAVANEIEDYHRHEMVFLNNGEFIAGKIMSQNDDQIVIKDRYDDQEHTFAMSKVERVQLPGRPILIGTVSIEKSETLSALLDKRGIKHEVLNAKHHKREAEIVAQAGRFDAVTIATNMAGRGTDIIMGGNPENMAWAQLQTKYKTRLDVPLEEWDSLVEEIDQAHQMSEMGAKVKDRGGLHVLGTERHDARRIDLQLRGRCGRQGDPGSSRFFLSLDDDLMRIFAGPFVKRMLEMGGFKGPEPMESKMVSRRIDGAQKKREEYNFEARKSLLEYDEVMDEQRKRVYRFRQRILDGVSCREIVQDMIEDQIENILDTILDEGYGQENFSRHAASVLSVEYLEPKAFRNLQPEEAVRIARDEANRQAETDILGQIEQDLPLSEDEAEWNWNNLRSFMNTRWKLTYSEKELRKIGRDRLDEKLIGDARRVIETVEVDGADVMLDEDYGLKSAQAWAKAKFGIDIDIESLKDVPIDDVKAHFSEKAVATYLEKEAVYPVMAGMYRFVKPATPQTKALLDAEGLVTWASRRFETELAVDDLDNKRGEEIHNLLLDKSHQRQQQAIASIETLQGQLEQMNANGEVPLQNANGAAKSLTSWFKESIDYDLDLKAYERMDYEQLEQRLEAIVEDHYHPEFRRMERMVLLEIVDSAWKDHLLAMDYLRSAVRQMGMAQLDPKVEYKRQGMEMFKGLWASIGERVTDLVFRVEQLNEDFVSHTLTETTAKHEEFKEQLPEPQQKSDMQRQQEEAIANSGGNQKTMESLRNVGPKIKRNDPCPCGSGKKYKNCCLRK